MALERVLLVAGEPNSGKSVQLRSMFLDPRLGGAIPTKDRIAETYALSAFRKLYVRLTSPHEGGESLEEFLDKIATKTGPGRWNVASAVQVEAAFAMPSLSKTVQAIVERFSPERVRVAFLSPDRHGNVRATLPSDIAALRTIQACEVMSIDSRTRDQNGLLLADTFDFA